MSKERIYAASKQNLFSGNVIPVNEFKTIGVILCFMEAKRETDKSGQMHNLLQTALNRPDTMFGSPAALVDDSRFTRDQKLYILKNWAWDEMELLVAEEENMHGSSDNNTSTLLTDIRCAMARLS